MKKPSAVDALGVLAKLVDSLAKPSPVKKPDVKRPASKPKAKAAPKPRGLRGDPIPTPPEWVGVKKVCKNCNDGIEKDVAKHFGFRRMRGGSYIDAQPYCRICRQGYALKARVYKTKYNP